MAHDDPFRSTSGLAKAVTAHTPDPTKYHSPTYQDGPGSKLGNGPRGLEGAVVPRARNDGTSRGIDHERPGIVIVDPFGADGGILLDTSQLRNADIEQALAQVGGNVGYGQETDDETFAVLAMLGKPTHEATEEEMTPEYLSGSKLRRGRPARSLNPLAGNSYVTPRSNSDGVPTSAPRQPKPRRRIDRLAEQPQALAQPAMPNQAPKPKPKFKPRPIIRLPASVPEPEEDEAQQEEDPMANKTAASTPPIDVITLMQQQNQLMAQMMVQVMQGNNTRSAPAPMASRRRDDAAEREAALEYASPEELVPEQDEEMIEETEHDFRPPARSRSALNGKTRPQLQPRRRVPRVEQPEDGGTEDTEIPFLTSTPQKPSMPVTFNLGPGGTVRKRYHAVVKSASCITLVYDMRYEEGDQFIPPELHDGSISVVLPGESRNGEEVFVKSLGLQYNLGCLDFIVLVIDDEHEVSRLPQGLLDNIPEQ